MTVELIAPAVGLSEAGEIGAEDVARFAAWAASYAKLAAQEANQTGLLTLGWALYGWLDGGERWLERLLAVAEPPLVVEFRSLANPDATAAAFLQVPWELLANEQGFLAADAVLNYCPLRRLSEPGAIPRASEPAPFPLEPVAWPVPGVRRRAFSGGLSSALLLFSISTRPSDQDVDENGDAQGQEHR